MPVGGGVNGDGLSGPSFFCEAGFPRGVSPRMKEGGRFDYDCQEKCVENRDCEGLGMYVMDLLMGEE